jgi:hypothetical protein
MSQEVRRTDALTAPLPQNKKSAVFGWTSGGIRHHPDETDGRAAVVRAMGIADRHDTLGPFPFQKCVDLFIQLLQASADLKNLQGYGESFDFEHAEILLSADNGRRRIFFPIFQIRAQGKNNFPALRETTRLVFVYGAKTSKVEQLFFPCALN